MRLLYDMPIFFPVDVGLFETPTGQPNTNTRDGGHIIIIVIIVEMRPRVYDIIVRYRLLCHSKTVIYAFIS